MGIILDVDLDVVDTRCISGRRTPGFKIFASYYEKNVEGNRISGWRTGDFRCRIHVPGGSRVPL